MFDSFVLVAVLTLPYNLSTVYEIQGRYKTMQACNIAKNKSLKTTDRYRKSLQCLPINKN